MTDTVVVHIEVEEYPDQESVDAAVVAAVNSLQESGVSVEASYELTP